MGLDCAAIVLTCHVIVRVGMSHCGGNKNYLIELKGDSLFSMLPSFHISAGNLRPQDFSEPYLFTSLRGPPF